MSTLVSNDTRTTIFKNWKLYTPQEMEDAINVQLRQVKRKKGTKTITYADQESASHMAFMQAEYFQMQCLDDALDKDTDTMIYSIEGYPDWCGSHYRQILKIFPIGKQLSAILANMSEDHFSVMEVYCKEDDVFQEIINQDSSKHYVRFRKIKPNTEEDDFIGYANRHIDSPAYPIEYILDKFTDSIAPDVINALGKEERP